MQTNEIPLKPILLTELEWDIVMGILRDRVSSPRAGKIAKEIYRQLYTGESGNQPDLPCMK